MPSRKKSTQAKTFLRARCAKTGRFRTLAYARANPHTTVVNRVKRRGNNQ